MPVIECRLLLSNRICLHHIQSFQFLCRLSLLGDGFLDSLFDGQTRSRVILGEALLDRQRCVDHGLAIAHFVVDAATRELSSLLVHLKSLIYWLSHC